MYIYPKEELNLNISFPESDKLNAHFMVSSEHKIKYEFLDYDTDFK